MQELNNIQTQLAQEEAALQKAHDRIATAQQRISEAHAQITSIQGQIEATQGQIRALEDQARTIERRIALLREYMEMAATSSIQTPPPMAAPQPATPVPVQAPTPVPAPAPAAEAKEPESELLPDFEAEDEIGELAFEQPLTAPTNTGAPAATDRGSITFENMDEELLTHELLPRTSTFEEELLLMMAYHRKTMKPKDVASRFRRLDYAPKVKPTEDNIRLQVESDHHFFEFAAEGRIALTEEGREEAERLLQALL